MIKYYIKYTHTYCEGYEMAPNCLMVWSIISLPKRDFKPNSVWYNRPVKFIRHGGNL